jgi:retron-type reverse transcriptase
VPSALLKKVWSLRNLERAWRIVSENARNSKSEEVKKEIEEFREEAPQRLRSLSGRLSAGTFKFPPARGIAIPKLDKHGKKDKSKFRPIVLADVESRIVQRSILDALLTVPDLQKYVNTPYSFGGVRKASEKDLAAVPAAISAALDCIQAGANFVACADISKFFTRIPKGIVTTIVADAVKDDEFMDFFRKAIAVELSNMAELREKSDAFPIYDIGVAQGSSLSPFLGNILLFEFDCAMNEGDCNCLRYVDDVIILAPTRQATRARLRKAEQLLAKFQMSFGPEKSSKTPISVSESFEFLGIELSNGLIRPSGKSQTKFLSSLATVFDESRKAIIAHKKKMSFKKSNSLISTLRRVDGITQGWGKHYRFCNDMATIQSIDSKISDMVRSYIGVYSAAIASIEEVGRRNLLGVELLGQMERKPFQWPK